MTAPPVQADVSGHFGELIQGRLGPEGPVVLVTLPAPPLRVRVEAHPGPFRVHCAGPRAIDRARVGALHRAIAGGPPRVRIVVRSGMPAGGGAGSSTAALVAVAAVLSAAHGKPPLAPGRLAELCLRLEGATDPLMYPDPAGLLWAPRAARTLERLPPLPAVDVVGGFLGAGIRTDPADLDFADVTDLLTAWRPAAARGDLPELARLATESAARNAERRNGPALAPLRAVAVRLGALGVVAAHTGSARGLLFAPGAGSRAEEARAALRSLGVTGVRHFRVGAAPRAG